MRSFAKVLPDDGFGQVMVAHFAKLGSPLKCIHQYPTGESQVQRYTHLVRILFAISIRLTMNCCVLPRVLNVRFLSICIRSIEIIYRAMNINVSIN
jgi:hypothetical protein